MMRRAIFLRLVPFIALSLSPLGCNGCEDPVSPFDGDGKLPVAGEQGGPRALTYVGENPVELVRNAHTSLRFTLKQIDNGMPVVGEPIAITVSGTAVFTSVTALPTDASGAIDVQVNAGDLLGEATLTAQASDVGGKMLEDGVVIRVVEDPFAGVHVTVDSDARVDVETAFVRLYTGVNPPNCTTLLADSTPPNSSYSSTLTDLPAEDDFENLTTGHKATVLVEGRNDTGVVVAKGCGAAGPLPGGVLTDIDVTLTQGETTVEGDYDVLMHMALGDALPSPYDENVEMVTALLSNPAGYALYVSLREADRSLGTSFVTRNGVEQSYRTVEQNPNQFTTWKLANDALTDMLIDQLGQTYVDVTSVGAGVRDVVTDFEVGARFGIYEVGDGVLSIDEQWQDVVLYWPLPCAESDGSIDMACARRPLSLQDENLAPVITSYGAVIDLASSEDESERFGVVTDTHGLTLRYGALLLAILNQVVFPSLPGNIAADNLGDVLTNLVGCSNIASSLFSDPTAQSLVEFVCEAGLDAAAAEAESQLLGLEVSSTNPNLGEEGLAAQGTFALTDTDHDLETETLVDYAYDVQWFVPNDPGASSDISAPIRGDGRRALTACVDDAMCGAGKTCQARGSYMKVAAVELGCARNIGTFGGGTACQSDSQCGSGLCAPVGNGGTLVCAETCDNSNDCTAGFACSDVGGLISLDPMMDGLGDVSFPGCVGF